MNSLITCKMHLLNSYQCTEKYNLTTALVKKYSINWDWKKVSGSISTDYIEEDLNGKLHPIPWDWDTICHLAPLNFIIKHVPCKNVKFWTSLSSSRTITWDFIKINLDKPWNWYELSHNPSITWSIVESNPDLPWDQYGLSANPSITWDDIAKNLQHGNFDRCTLSIRKSIPLEIIAENPGEWYWNLLGRTANWDFITANLDKPWDWQIISSNPLITWDIIKNNPGNLLKKGDIPRWDWRGISANPSISLNIVMEDPGKITSRNWDWDAFSYNPSITWNDVEKNKHIAKFDWYGLSLNSSITWDDVVKNPDNRWNWHSVCKTKVTDLDKAARALKKLNLSEKNLKSAYSGLCSNMHINAKFISENYDIVDLNHVVDNLYDMAFSRH